MRHWPVPWEQDSPILLAILIPSRAGYLKTKSGKDSSINLILCFLFWIPGVVHALWKVLTQALC